MAALEAADSEMAARDAADVADAPKPFAFDASRARYAYPLSVAPMMAVTDRHWRYMGRLLSRRTLLYTEMVVDSALTHNAHQLGDARFLGHSPSEAPIAVQLGGNDAEHLGRAAALCRDFLGAAMVELNLNCGCPSNIVAEKHEFGARLMTNPENVRRIVGELSRVCPEIPITVKHRLGTDLSGSDYATTLAFVRAARSGGCRHFALHARSCVLDGKFSTQQNRTVPPLKPEVARMLARDVPDCTFAINGGLKSLDDCAAFLAADGKLPAVDSAMVGRAAWNEPWNILASADTRIFGEAEDPCASRRDLLQKYLAYADGMVSNLDTCEDALFRPLFHLFAGEQHAKKFRMTLLEAIAARARSVKKGRGRKSFDAAAYAALPPPSAVAWAAVRDAGISDAALDRAPGVACEPRPTKPRPASPASVAEEAAADDVPDG